MPTPIHNRKLPNYLRTFRKRAGFTQGDMAFLLGMKTSPHVSRYEHFRTLPSLKTAFAFEVIFRVPAKELFAGVYGEVEREIAARAALLAKDAALEPKRFSPAALQVLRAIAGTQAPGGEHP